MAWYDHNFPLYGAKAKNLKIPLSALKLTETSKMGQTSISNVKKVSWTKFERNPLENKRFPFFISWTPDSQHKTFFVLALMPPRVAKSTCLFYIHKWFWLQIFRISSKNEKLSTRKIVMASRSSSEKIFGIPKKSRNF